MNELGINGPHIWVRQKLKSGKERVELGVNAFHPMVQEMVSEQYPAFTVAELGVMLPEYCDSRKDGSWWVCDEGLTGNCIEFHGDTEAQARAAMLIYLLENNLTTADEVNKRLQE